ncbi:hypothetical protein [Streptomyces sp.]
MTAAVIAFRVAVYLTASVVSTALQSVIWALSDPTARNVTSEENE